MRSSALSPAILYSLFSANNPVFLSRPPNLSLFSRPVLLLSTSWRGASFGTRASAVFSLPALAPANALTAPPHPDQWATIQPDFPSLTYPRQLDQSPRQPQRTMAATAVAHGARSPSGPGAVDLEGSVVSSPLSEVDDGDANDDEIEHMQLDGRGHIARKASLSGDDDHIANHDGSDSDSALSDAASDVNSDVNDTEAETERLYDTPKNQRHRDVVVDQFNNGQVFEHTPSKLRRTPGANADMNIRDDLDLSVSGDEESAASSLAGREDSPTKPATTNDTSIDEDAQLDSHERKRKRSPVVDPAELDQPLRKRNGSLEAPGATVEQDTPMNEDDTTSANPRSRHQSGDEDETGSLSNRGVPVEASGRETRKSKRNSSKRKGLLAGEAAGGADSDTREDPADVAVEDDPEHPRDEVDGDAEEEADIAAKNIEESKLSIPS